MAKKNIFTHEDITSSHTNMLRYMGLIPFKGKTLCYPKTIFFACYCFVAVTLFNTMHIGYGIGLTKKKSLEIDYVCEQIEVNSINVRYIILYLNRKKVLKLLNMCKDLWSHITPEYSSIVRSYERKAFYFRNFIWSSAYFSSFTYIIFAQVVTLPPTSSNGTAIHVLPFKFYVEIHDEPSYTLVTVLQIITVLSISLVLTGINTVGLFFIMIACGYLKSLRCMILSFVQIEDKFNSNPNMERDKEWDLKVYQKIRRCVIFHQKIMLYCADLDKFMRGIYTITVFCTVYNMSILGIRILQSTEEAFKYTTLFLLNLFQFFTCQWFPEQLIVESEAIGNAAYFMSYQQFRYQNEANKILNFIILRAQKPVQMTAGGYIRLSIETFGIMIKSAFSFFTLLRNVNN